MVCLTVVVYGPLMPLLRSESNTPDWRFFLVEVAPLSVGLATVITLIQRPIRRSFVAALEGLDRVQRQQAITAVWRGDVPDDPAVLSAAIRLGSVVLGVQQRAPRWATRSRWVAPILLAALAIAEFAGGDDRRALAYGTITVLIAIGASWSKYAMRRTQSRLDQLRSAASPIGADPVLTETDYPASMSGRRRLLMAIAIGLAVTALTGAMTYIADRPNRTLKHDCRSAIHGISYFTHQKEMIDGTKIVPGGPSLAAYQDWSDEISHYAAQTSKSDIAVPMHHVADLSQQALALVRDTRNDSGATQARTLERVASYQKIIGQMLDETQSVLDTCENAFK